MVEIAILAALCVGLTEVVKRTRYINEQYMPVIALVLGLILSTLLDISTKEMVVQGLIIGLSAVGMYSGGRSVLK